MFGISRKDLAFHRKTVKQSGVWYFDGMSLDVCGLEAIATMHK